MTIAPEPPTLHSHEGWRFAFRDDRSREQSIGVVELAKFDGPAKPGTERPEIAAATAIKWCMLHSSTLSVYDTERCVQRETNTLHWRAVSPTSLGYWTYYFVQYR